MLNEGAELPHPREWPVYDGETISAAQGALQRQRVFDYGCGAEIAALEDALTARYGGRKALTFNSGTSALYATYRALGWSDGVEVIVPTFTFLSAASALLAVGAVPVLCDVRSDDGTCGVEEIAAVITPRTKGVVITHLFGQPCDMAAISEFCKANALALVEDCSHAHASSYAGKPLGLHGIAAVYSLGAQKMVSGGHGGALLTSSQNVFDIACLVGHFKHRARMSVVDPELRAFEDFALGGNLRMTPAAAILAHGLLRRLDDISAAKRRLVSMLLAEVATELGLTCPTNARVAGNGSFYDVVATMPAGASRADRDRCVSVMRRAGLRVRAPATGLLHRTSIITATDDAVARLGLRSDGLAAFRAQARHGRFGSADDLHDRLISFPSACLYGDDSTLVEQYGAAMHAIRAAGLL